MISITDELVVVDIINYQKSRTVNIYFEVVKCPEFTHQMHLTVEGTMGIEIGQIYKIKLEQVEKSNAKEPSANSQAPQKQ